MREGAALPARADHDQHLPAAQLVAIERRRAVRLSAGRIDQRPRLLHRRPRPGPLRRLGLFESAARDHRVELRRTIRALQPCWPTSIADEQPPRAMIYGANGYTGRLIARHAVERGLKPLLAGRNHEAVTALAGELGCRS